MKTLFCVFLTVVSHLTYSQENNFIPKNYTEFSKSPSNGENFKRIVSDFDNDSKNDIITVIHNKTYDDLKSNKKFLFIYLSSQKKSILVDFDIFYGVFFIPPKLKKKTLEFQLYQEGTGMYGHNLKLRYNNKFKKIELIGYDYSYRTPRGHCNKTYNLLTGKYIVINDFYDMKTDKTKIEQFSGTQKQRNKIFTTDFNNEIFGQLSEIGKKYERG